MAGLGPREIEHELAVGVQLDVQHDSADQPIVLIGEQVLGNPAGSVADAAVFLKRQQKCMRRERIGAIEQPVPGRGIDLGQRFSGGKPQRAQRT